MKTTTSYSLSQIENIPDYEQQASEFLRLTKSKLEIRFIETGFHFGDEKDKRDIYEFRLSKGSRNYTAKFGDSLSNTYSRVGGSKGEHEGKYLLSEFEKGNEKMQYSRIKKMNKEMETWDHHLSKPSNYSILACLQNYEPSETFDDFIADFGYEINSKDSYERAEKTFKAVTDEYKSLCSLYNDDELQALQSIA